MNNFYWKNMPRPLLMKAISKGKKELLKDYYLKLTPEASFKLALKISDFIRLLFDDIHVDLTLPKDIHDTEVLKRRTLQKDHLDFDYIRDWAKQLGIYEELNWIFTELQ